MSKSHSRSPDRRALGAETLLALVGAVMAALVSVAVPATLWAQHEHPAPTTRDSTRAAASPRPTSRVVRDSMPGMQNMMEGPLGISHERLGSGTSWMPDSTPMHATHEMWGNWAVMLHGVAFGQYDDQGSTRGARQFGIVDWEMLMAMRRVGTGLLHLHTMVSLEPATLGARGYPLLLQTGESYKGQPLHDRQHPHDAFMEVAAMFDQPITSGLAVELYGGPAGEPALGPVAFMHRPSAQSDPLAPLGHHWQDATHISFGVATAGVYSRVWKLEGSWFNGREPDENRWDFDLRRLDSWSGRLTVNPTGRLGFSGWYGFLPSPEALHSDESVHRYGASMLYGGRGVGGGSLATSLVWGANAVAGTIENSALAEANLEIGAKNTVFGRAEYVRKSAEDLVLAGIDPHREFDINALALGYVREIAAIRGGTIGVGGRASINVVPAVVGAFYGTRMPKGIDLYVRVRPKRMSSRESMSMPDHAAGDQPMPAMSMPGMDAMPPRERGHEMPMRPDSQAARRDSMPGMKPMRGMPGMPGMTMPHDSSPGAAPSRGSTMSRSSTAGMRPASPAMTDTMAGSPHGKGRASAPGHAHHLPGAARASHHRPVAQDAAKARTARSSAKKKMKRHAERMPGMRMPMDTTPARAR